MKLQLRPQPKYTIWVDQDSVIYDLAVPWYKMHNDAHPNHEIKVAEVKEWDHTDICTDAGCDADIYSFLEKKLVWEVGGVIGNSQEIMAGWKVDNIAKIGILTSAISSVSPSLKMNWLENHFGFIDRIAIVSGIRKSEMRGDILIDDSPLNLTDWQGCAILFTQPTNVMVKRLRANNWNEVDTLVRRMTTMLSIGYSHKEIELLLYNEQENKGWIDG